MSTRWYVHHAQSCVAYGIVPTLTMDDISVWVNHHKIIQYHIKSHGNPLSHHCLWHNFAHIRTLATQ